MLVYNRDIPTRGLRSKVDKCEVFPITFGELLKYLGDEQLTDLRQYVRDLELMVKKSPNVGKFSLLDADYLIYLMKIITISRELKINITKSCSECGGQHQFAISSTQLQFRDIIDDYLNVASVNLGGDDVHIKYTTIQEFIDFVSTLPRYADDNKIDVIKLASMLHLPQGMALNAVLNSVGDDIAVINALDSMWFDTIMPIDLECPVTKRGITATLSLSAVDIFQYISQSNPVTSTKIKFREVSEDKQSE